MARNDFDSNYLAHHGILGQKWGIRRYQNPDGTLTEVGKKRYGAGSVEDISSASGITKRLNDIDKARARNTRKLGKTMAKISRDNFGRTNTRLAKKSSEIQSNITKGHQETEKLLKKAEDQGYDVSSHYTRRLVSSGAEMIAKSLRNTAIASLSLSAITKSPFIVPAVSVTTAAGKKYNVKDPKEKTFKEKFAEANQKARESTSINAAVEKGINEYNSTRKLYEQTNYSKGSGWNSDISMIAAYGGEIKPSDLKTNHRDSSAYKEYKKARADYVKFEKSKDPTALDSTEALAAWDRLEEAGNRLSNLIEEDLKKKK